jgi:hypothetical protein
LRKKLEPSAESWVEEGRALGKTENAGAGQDEDLDELWSFAKDYVLPQVAKAAQLSRSSLDDIYAESDEEDEEEEEEGEEGGEGKAHAFGDGGSRNPSGVSRDLNAITRFMTTGAATGN